MQDNPTWLRYLSQFPTEEKRQAAACVFLWESHFTMINDLVRLFNIITEPNQIKMSSAELHPKRLLISFLYELDLCLKEMKAICHRQTDVDSSTKDKWSNLKRRYEEQINHLDKNRIKRIRHLTFHPKKLFFSTKETAEAFLEIQEVSVDQLQAAINAAEEYGFALRNQLYKIAPPFLTA